jgi:hypothetical protein
MASRIVKVCGGGMGIDTARVAPHWPLGYSAAPTAMAGTGSRRRPVGSDLPLQRVCLPHGGLPTLRVMIGVPPAGLGDGFLSKLLKRLAKLLRPRSAPPSEPTDQEKRDFVYSLLAENSQPNPDAIMMAIRDISIANMNIKAFGYDLARSLAAALPIPESTAPRHVGLASKASVQADLETDWTAHWSAELQVPVVFHRKLWEACYILQAIYEEGHLRAGARGLGFGCGVEVTPSYLASHDIAVTVTDLAQEDAQSAGWAATNQHISSLEQTYHPHLVSRELFDRNISLRDVDMTAIPDDLVGYDFCWSMCALEHLGTIQAGLDFIESSLKTLRPGGLAVHTTEFNLDPDSPTIDNWPTVLFQQKHFEGLAERLRAQGHYVAPFDFDYGDKPMDRFIDIPPFSYNLPKKLDEWFGQPLHMKVSVDGFPCTCFGIIIRKGGA